MDDLLQPDDINWNAFEAPAKQAAIGGIGSNPDAAAEALKLSKTTGAPPAAVEQAPDVFKQIAEQQKMNQVFSGNRELQTFVQKDQMIPKIVSDDWGKMSEFGTSLKGLQGPLIRQNSEQEAFEAFILGGGDPAEYSKAREQARQSAVQAAGQFTAGQLAYERGQIGAQRVLGDQLGMEANAEDRLKQIEESLKAIGDPKGIIDEIFNMFGNMTPSAGPTFAGAAVGTVVPGFGTGFGALTAFSVDQGRIAAGNKYLDMRKAGLSQNTAALTSVLFGAVVGGLNAVMTESVAKPWVELSTKMTSDALNKVVADKGARMALEYGAKELFRGGALGAGLMGLQTIASEVADATALAITNMTEGTNFENIFNNLAERTRMADAVTHGMIQGAKLIGMMHLPGVGANLIMDGLYIKQARLNQRALDNAMKARESTLTYQRAPELIGEFVKEHQLGTFGLDPQVALGLHKDNPAAFSFIPDFEQKANDALATGTKLEIDPAQYLQHVNTGLHAQLKDDLSVNEGLTVNEAKGLEENPPKYDTIYHGTPWDYTQVSDEKFLTGEGQNTYGMGHYWTQHRGIADFYKDSITDMHSDQAYFINGERANRTINPLHDAAVRIHEHLGDLTYAKDLVNSEIENKKNWIRDYEVGLRGETDQRSIDYANSRIAETKQELEFLAQVKHHMEDPNLPKAELLETSNLFPQVLTGKLKATEEEMTNLRVTLAEQNEKAKKAFEELFKLMREKGYNVDQAFIDNADGKTLVREAENTIGKKETRDVFIKNGIKAHKFETTQSQSIGGELFSKKENRFIKTGELSDDLQDALQRKGLAGTRDYIKRNLDDEGISPEDAKYYKKLSDELDALGDDIDRAPAHNYVILEGKNIEITHKNDVPVGPIERPDALKDPVRYTSDTQLAALRKILRDLPEDFEDEVFLPKDLADVLQRHGYEPLKIGADGSAYFMARDIGEVVYAEESLKQKGAKPADEARLHAEDVFNSTATEITMVAEATARMAGLNAIFQDAKAAGMTKPEFAIYAKKITEAQKAAHDKAVQVAAKEAKKRLEPLWKERFEEMRSEVEADIQNQPETNALQYLSQQGPMGKQKLDKKEVERLLGMYAGNRADYPGDLPKGIQAKDGIHPDVLAKALGYESGLELLTVLGRLEGERAELQTSFPKVLDKRIVDETNARMESKYGTLDEAVREAAVEAALNGKQLEVLAIELAQIAKIGGIDMPFKKEELEATLGRIYDKLTVGKNKAERWIKAAGTSARQAEMMLLRGKFVEAAKAKQRQMLAVRLAQEAKAFAQSVDKFERSIKPLLKNETVARYEQGYVSQLQRMFNAGFGLPMKRDLNELERTEQRSLPDFVREKGEKGIQLDQPTFLDNSFKPTKLENLTVAQHKELQEFTKQMLHNAKGEKEILLGGQKVELEKARSEAIGLAEKVAPAWQAHLNEPVKKAILHGVRVWDAANIRMERLLSWLDQRDPNGPWSQIMMRPFQAGKHFYMENSKKIATHFKALPKLERADDLVPRSPFRTSTGREVETNRSHMLMAMLNTGNEGNMRVLAAGYHTTPEAIMGWIHDNATKRDWDLAQAIWDFWDDQMFPHQERVAREMTGVGIVKVEPMEIETPHGTYRGGYFPLMEDFTSVDRLTRGDVDMLVGALAPVPTANYMKRRTQAAYPIDLNLDRLSSKIAEDLHYISYAKAWKDATTFFNDPRMRQSIDDAFGVEYRDNLQVYLNRVATNGGLFQRTGLEFLANATRLARQNAVMMLIGFKPSTALLHGGAALFNSMAEAGPINFLRAASDLIFRNAENGDRLTKLAYEYSPELRNRKQSLDRDIGAALDGLTGASNFRRAYIQFSTSLVAALDQYSATPTFWAGYTKFMKEYEGKYPDAHERAVYAAEKMVRDAHGSNSIVDLPSIMNPGSGVGGEAFKFFTMFGGFYNHIYNQIRDRGMMAPEGIRALADGKFSEAQVKFMGVLGGFLGYVLAGSLWHSAVRGYAPDEEDEWDPGGYAAHSIAEQMTATMPLVRDVAYWFKTGHKGKITFGGVLDDLMTGVMTPAAIVSDLMAGKPPEKIKNKTKKVVEVPGWLTGVGPSRTLSNAIQYMVDIGAGDARAPTGIYEWRNLVLDARAPVKRKKK